MKNFAFITVCALIALFMIAIMVTSPHPAATVEPLGVTEKETVSQAVRRIEGMRKHQLEQDPWLPDDAVVFFGDSLTAGLAVDAIAPRAVNYGIGGQTTRLLLDALPRYGSPHHVDLVVLTIGTVDVVSGRQEGLRERLQAIRGQIHTRFLWNALPPTTQADVGPVNEMIRELCEERPDCTFVPSPVTEEDLQPDGIHLTSTGYYKWMNALALEITP